MGMGINHARKLGKKIPSALSLKLRREGFGLEVKEKKKGKKIRCRKKSVIGNIRQSVERRGLKVLVFERAKEEGRQEIAPLRRFGVTVMVRGNNERESGDGRKSGVPFKLRASIDRTFA